MPKSDGQHWGPWYYAPGDRTLVLKDGPETYEVYLDDLHDSASILDWILQVSEKIWATPEHVGYLVQALDKVSDGLQGKVCPGGQNQQFDLQAYLSG